MKTKWFVAVAMILATVLLSACAETKVLGSLSGKFGTNSFEMKTIVFTDSENPQLALGIKKECVQVNNFQPDYEKEASEGYIWTREDIYECLSRVR